MIKKLLILLGVAAIAAGTSLNCSAAITRAKSGKAPAKVVIKANQKNPQLKTNGGSYTVTNDSTPRGFLLKSIRVEGKQINYSIYVPKTYDPAKPMPLIVFLHGYGECGTDGVMPLVTGLAQAICRNSESWDRFITLIPQKQEHDTYWEEAEIGTVMAEIKTTQLTYNIDSSRMYLTGLSQGGHGTYYIAAMYPKMFAAIAPMCGWANEDVADKIKNIPIWIFHGELDDDFEAFVQNSYNMDKWLKDRGAKDEKLTIVPGVAHACWDIGYQQHPLADWFLAHKLDK